MNILVACEESQRVCESFRLLGHNAFSCDIIPCSWVNGDSSKYHKGIKPLGKSSACDRSKTFNGVACAMAMQWGTI